MSSSTTLQPTMSQSVSRWPTMVSLMSSLCFWGTVSAARTSTFFGRSVPPWPSQAPRALAALANSLMAATTLMPCRCLLPVGGTARGRARPTLAPASSPAGGR
ncbi:hypothetical protein BS78_03G218200 [Paspalum vaginatum]|nr:hypothetical protein BS78_03G218200 [Paspalum vaginatum]